MRGMEDILKHESLNGSQVSKCTGLARTILLLIIIISLLCSCNGGDTEYSSYTNGANRIFNRNALSKYTKQDFVDNYAKDVNDFYNELLNTDITERIEAT
jgi:hypothetical protein